MHQIWKFSDITSPNVLFFPLNIPITHYLSVRQFSDALSFLKNSLLHVSFRTVLLSSLSPIFNTLLTFFFPLSYCVWFLFQKFNVTLIQLKFLNTRIVVTITFKSPFLGIRISASVVTYFSMQVLCLRNSTDLVRTRRY